jgi:WD40 repeat protein
MPRAFRPWLLAAGMALLPADAAQPAGPFRPRLDSHGDPLPPGVLARLGTVRLRPGNSCDAPTPSPDGKLLATAERGKVRLWDLATGKEVRAFDMPSQGVMTTCFTPDGRYVVVLTHPPGVPGSGRIRYRNRLFVGEVAGGKVVRQLRRKRGGGFDSVGLLGAGKLLAALERDDSGYAGAVVVWDLSTGRERWRFPGARAWAGSPDGKTLAVGDADGTIRLRHVWTGKELRRLKGHRAAVCSLAFSPYGKTLASGGGGPVREAGGGEDRRKRGARDDTVRLWDVAAGKERLCLTGHSEVVYAVRFSPDGRVLASEDVETAGAKEKNTLLLWDVRKGKLRQRFHPAGGATSNFTFSPDGRLLAWQAEDDTVRLWDVAGGKERYRWACPLTWTGGLAFSPDGKVLFAGGSGLLAWDVTTGKEWQPREAHRTAVAGLSFSPDGRTLVSRDGLGLRAWDVPTGKPLSPFAGARVHRGDLLGFGPGGKFLLTLGRDRVLRRWERASGRKLNEIPVGGDPEWPVAVDPRCEWVAVPDKEHRVDVWDVRAGKRLLRVGGECPTSSRTRAWRSPPTARPSSPGGPTTSSGCGNCPPGDCSTSSKGPKTRPALSPSPPTAACWPGAGVRRFTSGT